MPDSANTVEAFAPSRFTASGCVTIRGKKIPYNVTSEDNIIYSAEGKALGSVFSYSYIRSDIEDNSRRPVIFVFNGGPGCSCVWLHVGMFGPYRVKYDDPVNPPTQPPYEIEENPFCLLDDADIVLIDPVGTGYGVLLDPDAADRFWGTQADAESILDFVELWISRNHRWQSPKFLAGESYGTTRASLMAGIGSGNSSKRQYAMSFNGIILIGGGINPYRNGAPTEQSVVAFPTYSVTNWYHHHTIDKPAEEVIEDAWNFAIDDYLPALFKGNSLKGRARNAIKERIKLFTNMDDAYLERNYLRIDRREFTWEVIKEQHMECGFYDSRFTQPLHSNRTGPFDTVADEASMGKFSPSFIAALNGPIKEKLNITFNRPHEGVSFDCTAFWQSKPLDRTTAEALSAAQRRLKDMQVLFINGYYDMAGILGNTRFCVNQSGLIEERTFVNAYPSGHMAYLGDDSFALMEKDIRALINGKLKK